MSFNPRARVGRDVLGVYKRGSEEFGFQSTRPRGARPKLRQNLDSGLTVSIHAPAWGATLTET